jgi:predicted phage replisome organizer
LAEIKWIKITTDVFDDEKIDFISSLPEGDSLIVVWVRLLTMAGKNNAGGFIFLTENIPYSEDMLSHKFKKPLNVIKLALKTFKELNMIEFDECGRLIIANWEKHQNVDALEKIREKTRVRVAKYRESKLLQCNVTVTDDVTPSNALDKDIDKDKEKELSSHKLKFTDEHIKLANYLKELILLNNTDARVPVNINKWANDIRLMCEIDKRYPDNIEIIIEWCQKDSFWKTNILSTDKLRKQFDQLTLKMKQADQQIKLFNSKQPIREEYPEL